MARRMSRGGLTAAHAGPIPVPSPQVVPQPAAPAAGPRPTRLVRWSFYAFVFSLAFDAPGRLPIELTTMTGALLLLVACWQPRLCFGRRPAAFWWFLGYLYVYWLAFVVGGGQHASDAVRSFLFAFQALLIFLVAFNLMRFEVVARQAWKALVLAAVILALMTVLGIMTKVGQGSQRVTVFGQNPNRAGVLLAVGLLASIGLAYGPSRWLRPRWLAWPAAALIGMAMIKGGSRGSLVAMAAGLWTFSFFGRTLGVRLRNAAIAVLAMGFLGWLAMRSPVMQHRIQQAQQGDLAGRQNIFPAAWHMFLDRPVIGWGPDNQYVLAIRLRLPPALWASRDTHNLVLEVLTATGLAGSIPVFLGFWLCFWAAWRARAGPEGIMPLTLLLAMLVADMSGNYVVLKLQWVILAYAAASGSRIADRRTWNALSAAAARLPRRMRRSGT
jgi:O-antigen ligase